MNRFVRGQRWVSDAEADQGLGTVIEADQRTVTLYFPATQARRTYAIETAPLTRALFTPGSEIVSEAGWALKVTDVRDRDGLLTYVGLRADGSQAELPETALGDDLRLNRPADRLLSLRIDAAKWFELRYQTLREVNRLAQSGLWGLTGGRTSLIPHQLYVAHEVANRYAPRVLLADEVGLGKTIEAGMILHHQLLLERARRVLVVTPPTLTHQWLVEMLRRFNLRFSVFDVERWRGLRDEPGNPFDSEQLVLCSLDFLLEDPVRLAAATASDWDMLVVDEAHHLEWSEAGASPEYQAIDQLARTTPGVLLLTATPEQLGKAAHFARLRLLDPDRYPDLSRFLDEEERFRPVADAVEALLDDDPLTSEVRATLAPMIAQSDNRRCLETLDDDSASASDKAAARQALVTHLLDRHGVGRVLFRNTRAAVKGFPGRALRACPLPCPAEYRALFDAHRGDIDVSLLATPEVAWQRFEDAESGAWTAFDPRSAWLLERLQALDGRKALLIAAHAGTVLDLADMLRWKSGVHAAVFHERMSIVERDRAAAFFADPEDGAQILICSEIGSEGRNFQFAHDLILFDLPVDPDLLEQRIGRLDRIGQTQTIQIHVPFLEDTPQQILLDWHHRGLGAFEAPCPAAHGVFSELGDDLRETLAGRGDPAALVDRTAALTRRMSRALHQGRDRLLEYNSCRPAVARRLVEAAEALDQPERLFGYMERVFDCFGVDYEPHSAKSWILRPGSHLQGSFPALPDDGVTVTFFRDVALANEDQHFLSWEHPMVHGAMEMVLAGEQGNTGFTAIRHPQIRPGSVFLECLHVIDSPTRATLATRRYLPPIVMRTVVDQQGRDIGERLTHERIAEWRLEVNRKTAVQIVEACLDSLEKMLTSAERLVERQAPGLIEASRKRAATMIDEEIERLRALRQSNPNIRDEEIDHLQDTRATLLDMLDKSVPRLDAVRVVVAA